MELPHIGRNCIICNRNDYLPFKCSHCEKIVCVDHKFNHGIECPLERLSFINDRDKLATESLKKPCDFCKKITLKLELVECQYCNGNHCLYHRHQVQHECRQLAKDLELRKREAEEKRERQIEALNRLKEARIEPSNTRSSSSAQQPTTTRQTTVKKNFQDPKKQALAKRLRIMKIKQSARGPTNILDSDKIFFEIKFIHNSKSSLSDSTKHNNSVRVFTTNKHTVGRMIDWSAEELGIKNKNHIQGADQLVFKRQEETGALTILDSQKTFQDHLDLNLLENGDELLLTFNCE